MHADFADWIAQDCPLEPDDPEPEIGCVWLLAGPDGLPAMRRLCGALGVGWSLGQMQASMNDAPTMLAEGVDIDRLRAWLRDDGEWDTLLAVSDTPDAPRRPIRV